MFEDAGFISNTGFEGLSRLAQWERPKVGWTNPRPLQFKHIAV